MIYFLIFLFYSAFYIFFQSHSIFGGDAGDLVTAAFLKGVSHPPGYPLYTFFVYLLTKLPLNTVAWRAGLLSSIPASFTIVVLYKLISDITKNKSAALIASASLSFCYLFWLYASVSEVFSLHIALSVLLMYLLFKKRLTLFCFVFGLSLTHHHIILFYLPAFLYYIYQHKKSFFIKNTNYLKLLLVFALGLLPYAYIVWASLGDPMINWGNVHNLSGFIKLVTRAEYGTFQSGAAGQTLMSRFLQLPVIFEFTLADFTVLGVLLIIIGLFSQFKRDKRLFMFTVIGYLFTGPLFFFYASYILITSFSLGTVERFLLSGYIFITIWIAEGILGISESFQKIIPSQKKLISKGIILIASILPLFLFYSNLPKIGDIKNDLTSENYAKDTLDSIEKNGILFLQRDTTVFDVEYVYFTQKYRPDVIPIHFYRFAKGELIPALTKHFPDLKIPNNKDKFIENFILLNYEKSPIYTNATFYIDPDKGAWVREGLVYRFYKRSEFPKLELLLKRNNTLWKSYHDPVSDRSRDEFALMPSNVLDFYRESRLETGKLFEDAGDAKTALKYYLKALPLDPEYISTYYHLSLAYGKLGRCSEGFKILEISRKIKEIPQLYYFLGLLYKDCYKDEVKAKKFFDQYDALQRNNVKLKEL